MLEIRSPGPVHTKCEVANILGADNSTPQTFAVEMACTTQSFSLPTTREEAEIGWIKTKSQGTDDAVRSR